ncbi:MAG: serine--tRNA ligase, partial [Candidatus Omnitrophica bacterium]|nr:serine--tRNA ligase [Candidatus Omnitrophota bacterium]
MFDIKLIREDAEAVRQGLAKKNVQVDLDVILNNDARVRDLMLELDDLRSRKNAANDEISKA